MSLSAIQSDIGSQVDPAEIQFLQQKYEVSRLFSTKILGD